MGGENMKRALAYMVTGIFLGIAIMFIPLMMFIPLDVHHLSTSWNTFTDSARTLGTQEYVSPFFGKTEGGSSETEGTLGVGGGITYPSSLLYVVLIFAVGLVSALGVYGLFKRRLMG